jgi:hypothetical protein
MKISLIKTGSLILLLAFFTDTCCYGLAALSTSHNSIIKREILMALRSPQSEQKENAGSGTGPESHGIAKTIKDKSKILRTYFSDTFNAMQILLSTRSGLPADRGLIENGDLKISNHLTSPTNMAMALLQYVCARDYNIISNEEAKIRISSLLYILQNMQRHESGLFYAWYRTDEDMPYVDDKTGQGRYVPLIDNANLTTAIKIVAEAYSQDAQTSSMAKQIIEQQSYACLYDEEAGLLMGGIKVNNSMDNWHPAETLGSESRLAEQMLAAMGKIPKESIANSKIEIIRYRLLTGEEIPVLATWDGGVFQMFLPNIFVAEDSNPVMRLLLRNYIRVMQDYGKRRNILGKAIAGGYSACQITTKVYKKKQGLTAQTIYQGSQGLTELAQNQDAKKQAEKPIAEREWEMNICPYGFFLAGSVDRDFAIDNLTKLREVSSQIYSLGKRVGFVDSINVDTKELTPILLFLDLGMTIVSLDKMQDPEGLGVARYLYYSSDDTGKNLKYILSQQDNRLKKAIKEAGFDMAELLLEDRDYKGTSSIQPAEARPEKNYKTHLVFSSAA